MVEIELPIRGRHFREVDYNKINDCVLCKAAKEYFVTMDVLEDVSEICINDIRYKHHNYEPRHFEDDLSFAKDIEYDDTVVRLLKLRTSDKRAG